MYKKVLSFITLVVIAVGLTGCGASKGLLKPEYPKETSETYPFFKEMQIIKLNDEEVFALKDNEEKVMEKCNDLKSEFYMCAARDGGSGIKQWPPQNNMDITEANVELKQHISDGWIFSYNLMGFELPRSSGGIAFGIMKDDKGTYLSSSVLLMEQSAVSESRMASYSEVKNTVSWLNENGINIDLNDVQSKFNDMIVRSDNGEVVEKEVVKLSPMVEVEYYILTNSKDANGKGIYNVCATINFEKVYIE